MNTNATPSRRLVAAVANRSLATLLPVLDAASISPTAAHRGPTIAAAYAAAAKSHPRGRAAARGDLPAILNRVAAADPRLATLEDFVPHDGRAGVVVRWGPSLHGVLPGALELPVGTIGLYDQIAAVIDPVLADRLGFGLFDAGELVLRRMDHVLDVFAQAWPAEPTNPAPGLPATLTDAEVRAASSLEDLADTAARCSDPDCAAAALQWCTTRPRDLEVDLSNPTSTFGRVLAVRSRGTSYPIPSGMLAEAFLAIGRDLAALARSADIDVRDRFHAAASERLADRFAGLAIDLAGPVGVGPEALIHSVVTFGPRRFLAVDIAAALNADDLRARLKTGAEALRRIRPGTRLTGPGGTLRLPEDGTVAHLQVIAQPHVETMLPADVPGMSSHELEWILRSAQDATDDFFHFVNDIETSPGIERAFAFDTIDQWEVWRESKSFYNGAIPVNAVFFAAHASSQAWDEAARDAPVERALHTVGLPPLRDWPMVEIDQNSAVVARVGSEFHELLPGSVPTDIDKSPTESDPVHREALWSLTEGIAWKINKCADTLVDVVGGDIASLRIRFDRIERTDGPSVTIGEAAPGQVVLAWDDRLLEHLERDAVAVEHTTAVAIAQALPEDGRNKFIRAWDDAPPGLRADKVMVLQTARDLPDPTQPHGAIRAAVLRDLADHVHDQGVPPGELTGKDATGFENRTVLPWLIDRLHITAAALSGPRLLAVAADELERISRARAVVDRQLSFQQGFPVNDIGQYANRRDELAAAFRAASLVTEEVLARPPDGDTQPDRQHWAELLAIGELAVQSYQRSDEIHHRLRDSKIEITGAYEIHIAETGRPTDIDLAAYKQVRRIATLPTPVPLGASTEDPANEQGPLIASLPELTDIDAAMRRSLRFGLDALLGILNVTRTWDTGPAVSATVVSKVQFLTEAAKGIPDADSHDLAATLDRLTLKGQDLADGPIHHWETERRTNRVTLKPFLEADDEIWLLPWTADLVMRVYSNYLGDGRLPWPPEGVPDIVEDAVNAYRQQRNRDLEKDCIARLASEGLPARRVRPEKARSAGIEELSGEIDALCVDSARSRIWVIEAKDPYTPFSARQMRRSFDKFIGEYVPKLLTKTADVARDPGAVAAAMGVPNAARDWTVHPLMVTRRPEPAGFGIDLVVPTVPLDDIIALIVSADGPPTGAES